MASHAPFSHTSRDTACPVSLFLFFVAVCPATENTRSDGADVAGIDNDYKYKL